jgi:hypothetical protein
MDMRQLWTRASRPRFFLVVAALSVITLAVSSPIHSAVRGWHTIGHTSASPVAAAGRTAANADCSRAAAREVVERLGLSLNDPSADPIAKVLCGAFTGPGSQTMVVTLAGPMGPLDWVVFRWAGGAWQILMRQPAGASITASGSDIRQTLPIYRSDDPRCCPTGGTKSRIWHWNGTRFTAGPWKQVTPGKARKKDAILLAPLAACHMTDDGTFRGSWVYCWIGSSPHPRRHVKLDINGHFSLTATTAIPLGLGGPNVAYGTLVTAGRFRCQALRSGVKCTVISTGKGFLINSTSVRRVGP